MRKPRLDMQHLCTLFSYHSSSTLFCFSPFFCLPPQSQECFIQSSTARTIGDSLFQKWIAAFPIQLCLAFLFLSERISKSRHLALKVSCCRGCPPMTYSEARAGRKGASQHFAYVYIMYIYIYVCVCACVCVCAYVYTYYSSDNANIFN